MNNICREPSRLVAADNSFAMSRCRTQEQEQSKQRPDTDAHVIELDSTTVVAK